MQDKKIGGKEKNPLVRGVNNMSDIILVTTLMLGSLFFITIGIFSFSAYAFSLGEE